MDPKESIEKLRTNSLPINRSKEQVKDTLLLMDLVTTNYAEKLTRFKERNQDTSHINYKISHLLHDPYTFINAYANVSKNKGALTKGISLDKQTMKFFGQTNAINISTKFKENSYKFKPVRRTLIPKPGRPGKMRPIDTPTQEDRIVQEAIRGILESIYEPEFSDFEKRTGFKATNYGFRPNKSCFDAAENFKLNSQSCNYIIEGDIISAYNSVDQKILLAIISRRIRDKKFLALIKQCLESGIMEKNNFIHSLTGVPQGGIISPLLFNIYMFEFDKFMYKLVCKYTSKSKARKSTEYQRIGYKIRKLSERKPEGYIKEIKTLIKTRNTMPSYELNSCSKTSIFVRYADDWLLGINVVKDEAIKIKEKISKFLLIFLKLKLEPDKTLISHYQRDGISFLGYEIKMWSSKQCKIAKGIYKSSKGFIRITHRTTSRKITIRPNKNRIIRNLKLKGICDNNSHPIGVRKWNILEEFRIVERYRSIMLGITNYYVKCDNLYALNQISYLLQYSCAKTLASRKKITMTQVFEKYGKNLHIEVKIQGKDKEAEIRSIHFPTLMDLKESKYIENSKNRFSITKNRDPFHLLNYNRTKFKFFSCCCICGDSDRIAMHHINSLRSIPLEKRQKFDYLRSRLNRIQIPVCWSCHMDITHGRYNNPTSPTNFYDEWISKL